MNNPNQPGPALEALNNARAFIQDSIENGHLVGGDLGNAFGVRDEIDKARAALLRAESREGETVFPQDVEALKAARERLTEAAASYRRIGADQRADDMDIVLAALLRAEGESREGEHKEADAYLRALLDYSGGFYGACREAGLPAKTVVDAMAHIERAARNLHRLALAQPHHPTASVEAVARIIDADAFISEEARAQKALPAMIHRYQGEGEAASDAARRVGARKYRNTAARRAEASRIAAEILAALTAQQHPGLGSGGPTEELDGGRSGSSWSPIETAPTGVAVLVVCEEFVGEAQLTDDDGWWWANTHGEYHADRIYPTDWMPLPFPPSVATEATGVVPATTPSAPVPTEDHEQGVRGSEERAGGEG